jgi:hypothetical protein
MCVEYYFQQAVEGSLREELLDSGNRNGDLTPGLITHACERKLVRIQSGCQEMTHARSTVDVPTTKTKRGRYVVIADWAGLLS